MKRTKISRKALLAIPFVHANYETVSTLKDLDRWIAEATELGAVAVDTETDSLDSMQAGLVGVSLSTMPGKACYIPLAHVAEGGGLFGSEKIAGQIKLEEAIAHLKPLLENPGVLKIGQNLKYDLQVLRRYGTDIRPIDDTMLLSYAIESGENGHGMDEMSLKHLGHKPISFKEVAGSGKSAISFAQVPLDRATAYAAEDADVTLRLWKLLKPRLLRKHKVTVYETLERPLIPVLEAMEHEGILVDRAVLAKLSNEFANGQGKIEAQIHELAGERFNIGSPKQLGDILFGKMGLPGGRKTATGAWSTDSDALEDLAAQGIELARRVVDWRQLAKLRSTYTDALAKLYQSHHGPGAHELCDGGHLHGAAVIVRSQLAEHSGAHRGRPPHPHRFHRTAGHQAAQRRLQPDRAARAGPCGGYSAAQESLCRRA